MEEEKKDYENYYIYPQKHTTLLYAYWNDNKIFEVDCNKLTVNKHQLT